MNSNDLKRLSVLQRHLIILFIIILVPSTLVAQLKRERANKDPKIERTFFAPTNIGISTTENVDRHNLKSSIKHTFGLVSSGIDQFFGLDNGSNTKLSIDYGINDRISVGIGRMSFNKVVDLRSQYTILDQTISGSTPVSISIKGSIGIKTLSGLGYSFSDRLSYFGSLMVSRKINRLSLQFAPMISYFNQPFLGNKQVLKGLGIVGSYEINNRLALSGEYLSILGDRNPDTKNAMSIGLNIDTGGHIFQLFLSSTQWHSESFIMANNKDTFWKGDFRFGFNIHRFFGL